MNHFKGLWCLAWLRWACVGLCLLCGTASAQQTKPIETKPLTLLISIDGFKPSYLNASDTPNLFMLKREGAHAQGLISSFPSLTFPNHASIVTGQTPDHHGIINNTMTDPELPEVFSLSNRDALNNPSWWSEANPLWVTLKEQGKWSSTLFWPGSEVPIHGIQPNDWLPYQHQMPHAERIKTLVQWLSRPNASRADFATLYFSDVDSAGHQYGPDSEQVKLAARAVDHSIGVLIQEFKRLGLWDRTTMVIVSDHGMAKVEHSIVVASLLPSNSKARWEWTGALAGIRLRGEDAAPVLKQLDQVAHVQCWPKELIPGRFRFGHHRRIPDIVCLAEPGYALTLDASRKGALGQHGYDPMDESMWGILIAAGYRIQAQSSGLVANIDIYPFLCQLLGVTPGSNDGDPSTLKSWLVKP